MITEDYVSFELAKLLKEKGFDESCDRYAANKRIYDNYEWTSCNITGHDIGIPTLYMALKWLRDVHHIYPDIAVEVVVKNPLTEKTPNNTVVYFSIKGIYNASTNKWDNSCISFFKTYEQAAETAVKYTLEHLI